VRFAGVPVADDRGALRREVLRLVGLVLVVDGVVIAGYFIAGLTAASAKLTFGYMIVWTGVTLAVVLRGLGRCDEPRIALTDLN
jgi:hypothetical protein